MYRVYSVSINSILVRTRAVRYAADKAQVMIGADMGHIATDRHSRPSTHGSAVTGIFQKLLAWGPHGVER